MRTDWPGTCQQAPIWNISSPKSPRNPARALITGKVCGVDVQQVDNPLMREIRFLDKLVDELTKGRPMAKILRQG